MPPRWMGRPLLSFGLVLLMLGLALAALPSSLYTLSEPITKRVELTYVLANTGRGTLTDVHVYFGVPPRLPEQELETLSWTPPPTRYVYDSFGQRLADFEVGRLGPGQSFTIRLTAVGKFWRIRYHIDPDKVGSLEEIPPEIVRLYTADGPYYRITDPLIVSTARRVVGEERNPYLMALRIHDFVARTLRGEPLGRWDDAVTVLERGTGSCSEFTFVFIALARAVGLPARFAGGSVYIPQGARRGRFVDRVLHRWPEVYLPGYGWVPFDPTWDRAGAGRPVSREYVGSHGYALVMVRGGGTDERYLGIYYPEAVHGRGSSTIAIEREFVWSDR